MTIFRRQHIYRLSVPDLASQRGCRMMVSGSIFKWMVSAVAGDWQVALDQRPVNTASNHIVATLYVLCARVAPRVWARTSRRRDMTATIPHFPSGTASAGDQPDASPAAARRQRAYRPRRWCIPPRLPETLTAYAEGAR